MANKLDGEARMTIKVLAERGHSNRAIARLLGVHENAVRYHRRRQASGAIDGRSRQKQLAEAHAAAITHWLEQVDGGGSLNLAALHDWLVHEHGYAGSLRSLQRYFRAHYPRPRIRARRRVETPPGAQAQADWGEYPDVCISGRATKLSVFALKLSWSRYAAFIWSLRQDQLAWHRVHNEAFRRFAGIPAVVRYDFVPGNKIVEDLLWMMVSRASDVCGSFVCNDNQDGKVATNRMRKEELLTS